MANTQNYYYAVQTHFFALDTDITAGLTSPAFTRNFRVLDIDVFVTNSVPGATLTLSRVRSGASTTLAQFDVSGTGRAPIIIDIDQLAALFESGDQLKLVSSGAALDGNVIVYLQQFSV